MNGAERNPYTVRRLSILTDVQMHGLAIVMIDCVEGGASVSFMHPLRCLKRWSFGIALQPMSKAAARAMLVAEDASGIVGTVQIVLD